MMRVSEAVILVTLLCLDVHGGHVVDAGHQACEVAGAGRILDDVHAARDAGELVDVGVGGVDDRVFAAAGVHDAGHAEFGTGGVHDVTGDTAVFGLLVDRGVRRSAVGAGVIGCTVADGDGGADSQADGVGDVASDQHLAVGRPRAVDHPVMVEVLDLRRIHAGHHVRRGVDAHVLVAVGGVFRGTLGLDHFSGVLHHRLVDAGLAVSIGRFGGRDNQVRAVRTHLLVHLLRHSEADHRQTEQCGCADQRRHHSHHRARTPTEHGAEQHSEEHTGVGHRFPPSTPT